MSLLLSFTKNWDNIRKNTQKLRSKLLVSDRFLPKSLLTWVLLSYWQVLTLSVFRIEFWESSPPTVQFTLDLSPTGTCRMATSYASWFSWVHSLWTQKMWQSSFKQQLNDSMIASLSLILSLIQKMKIVTTSMTASLTTRWTCHWYQVYCHLDIHRVLIPRRCVRNNEGGLSRI